MSSDIELRQSIGRLAKNLGPALGEGGLTCTEAEAIADVLRTADHTERAKAFLDRHAYEDDDPEDLHHARFHVLHDSSPYGCCQVEPEEKVTVATWKGDDTVTQASESTAWLRAYNAEPLELARAVVRLPAFPPLVGERLVDACDGCDRVTPGIRFNLENGAVEGIERCDSCERYESDLDAAAALAYILMVNHPALGIIEVRYEKRIE